MRALAYPMLLSMWVILTTSLFADKPDKPGEDAAPPATVKIEGATSFKALKVGVPLWSSTDRYSWTKIPAGFEGAAFSQFDDHHKGLTEFKIRSTGKVQLAVTTRWGGGGRSGGWSAELTSKEDFLAQGWRQVARIQESGGVSHGYEWVIYERVCKAGERFKLRTEKYCAPILIL